METKVCSKCGVEKPATLEYFYKKIGGRNGINASCIECHNRDMQERRKRNPQQWRLYWQDHKEEIRRNQKRYYDKNRDLIAERQKRYKQADRYKEYTRIYYQKNKEAIRERARKRYHANPLHYKLIAERYKRRNPDRIKQNTKLANERSKDRVRLWRNANREKINTIAQRRRALKRNAKGSFTPEDVILMRKNQKGRCWWCGEKLSDEKGKVHIDHRIPLSRGGSNAPSNLVLSCQECNLSKGAKLPHEWGGRLL